MRPFANDAARACVLVGVIVISACGSDPGSRDTATPTLPDTATAPSEPVVVSGPSTTVHVPTPTTEPLPAVIPDDAVPLLGLWRVVGLAGADATEESSNPTRGYIRVDAPPGFDLSISTFRALDPDDYICGGGGGALEVADQALLITNEYEATAAECLDEISDLPIVESIAACLRTGCPYVLADGMLDLTFSGQLIELERIE